MSIIPTKLDDTLTKFIGRIPQDGGEDGPLMLYCHFHNSVVTVVGMAYGSFQLLRVLGP